MKHVKKLTTLFLVLMLALSLSACGSTTTDEESDWETQQAIGLEYYEAGDYENAINTFSTVIESEPNRAELLINRAEAYYERAVELENDGDTESAREFFEMAQADYENAHELINSEEAVDENTDNFEEYVRTIGYRLNYIENFISNNPSYNEYGALSFSDRKHYKEFEELSTALQDYIETLIPAVIDNEIDSIDLDILSDIVTAGSRERYYTLWNGYKIWINIYVKDNGHTELEVEIRPENGMGAYLYIEYDPNDTAKTIKLITYTTCQCVDWQWNGEYNSLYQLVFSDEVVSTTTTGVMVESKRDGTFTCSDGSYDIYVDGVWVENEDGAVNADYEYIGTISSPSLYYYDESDMLEALYW